MADSKNEDNKKQIEQIIRDYSANLETAFRAPDFAKKVAKLLAAKGRIENLPRAGNFD